MKALSITSMQRFFFLLLTCALLAFAQATPPTPDQEQEDLRRAVSEGSSSAVDLIRALEGHLARFPKSVHLDEIERALTKAAIEAKDERRIALYGRRALAKNADDLPTLDRVTRALLTLGDAESSRQALQFAKRFEEMVKEIGARPAPAAEAAKRKPEIDRAIGRALLSQALATGNLGDAAAAAELARRSFESAPTVEAAAELGRRLAQLGRNDAAVEAYADAFTMADANTSEAERTILRRRMGELYSKAHKGSETGLGEIVLKAWDRNAAGSATRTLALRALDPNSGATNPLDFVLTGINGEKLPLASLRGKAVVLDFWATWCGPCRAQHPLYEEVKKRFADQPDVVFLAINTDEEREAVKPFLEEQGWPANKVFYEDGLSKVLRVTSIPTTVVFGRAGTIVSRMNGYDPERFVDMLTDRIRDALKN